MKNAGNKGFNTNKIKRNQSVKSNLTDKVSATEDTCSDKMSDGKEETNNIISSDTNTEERGKISKEKGASENKEQSNEEEQEEPKEKPQEEQQEEIDWKDKYIRLSAEFDNFRKRTVKEKIELIESGGERILKSIIDIIDDFERALKSLSEDSLAREGIELIYKKFQEFLKTQGVTQMEAINEPLNVDYHDAIAKIPTDNKTKSDTIIDVVQNGYMLKDKVLRFAKVVVAE